MAAGGCVLPSAMGAKGEGLLALGRLNWNFGAVAGFSAGEAAVTGVADVGANDDRPLGVKVDGFGSAAGVVPLGASPAVEGNPRPPWNLGFS